MKRQPTEWEIYLQGLNFQNIQTTITPQQQQKTQTKKWAEDLNRYFYFFLFF